MTTALLDALTQFNAEHRFRGKGSLSIAIAVTQHARKTLPLDPSDLLTEGGGQVKGAGGDAVQRILAKHGISRRLSSEGGRTNRGSLNQMRAYVALLNDFHSRQIADLDAIEKFWIDRVNDFFAGKPFTIKLDAARGLRAVVGDVLAQAEARQKTTPGVYYAGAVLQHLVGAKLDCALGKDKFEHHCFSTADAPGARKGDFFIGDVAIHVTTSPSEALLSKCADNLNDGHRPIIVTTTRGLALAEGLARNKNISDRLDVFEAEQFVALNLYELGKFAGEGRRLAVKELVERYNEIVDEFETDPSFKIELK